MFTCINVKSMKTKKIYKIKIKIKIIKIQETKLHSIPLFSGGIICGLHRRSFVVSFENHVRAYLGVILDLATFSVGDYLLSGIICSRGSFAALCRSHQAYILSDIWLTFPLHFSDACVFIVWLTTTIVEKSPWEYAI